MNGDEPAIAELRRLYLDEGLTTTAIARQVGMSSGTVWARLKSAGVEFRPRGTLPRLDPDDLRRWYLDEHLSTVEIARRTGTSTSGITSALQRAGIERRPLTGSVLNIDDATLARIYVDERRSKSDIAEQYQVATWAVTRRLRAAGIRRRPGRPPGGGQVTPDADELRDLYVKRRLTMSNIAARFGVPDPTVRRWLELADIPLRRPAAGQGTRPDTPPQMSPGLLRQWYTTEGRTTHQIAAELGISRAVVTTALHSWRIPTRPPGPSTEPPVVLLDALYADRNVGAVLRRHGIPQRPEAGLLRERWPAPVELSEVALRELYIDVGLSAAQISLITGISPAGIRHRLQRTGIRPRGSGRAPWQRTPTT